MNASATNYGDLPEAARAALTSLLARDDLAIVGIVLTGSAARGMATAHSDVDVIVVRDEASSTREVAYSSILDEIPMKLSELETIKPVGSEGAWDRWSFAWAQVLCDTTGGRVSAAVRRQARLSDEEVRNLLVARSRLDEFINFAYRALKSHRDGRPEAARLDAAESIASMLDVLFALSGRVRPYNKYLAWELYEHPLNEDLFSHVNWKDEDILYCINEVLDGSEDAVRTSFRFVERACRIYDRHKGKSVLGDVIDAWGDELRLLLGHGPRTTQTDTI